MFCLHPHQTAYVVPAADVTVVPDGVPADRAVLAGTVETAVNALWDAAPMVGDRVTVVGAGMVGCCVARLLSAIPGVEVTLVDVDPTRAEVADSLDVAFAHPSEAQGGRDLVVHASATEAGLQRSLELLAPDGRGGRPQLVRRHPGPARPRRRLPLRPAAAARQPGRRGGARRARHRRTRGERLALALDLLRDPAYDALFTGASAFAELPELMADLSTGRRAALCHTITYPTDREA